MKDNILNPTEELKLGAETITIRELAWPDAMEFLNMIASHISELTGGTGKFEFDTADIMKQLSPLITNTRGLAEFLAKKSTGKDDGWLSERTTREVFRILQVAIPLTLNQELITLGKELAGTVQGALGIKVPAPSQSASDASSKTDSKASRSNK